MAQFQGSSGPQSKYIEQWENAVDGEETTVAINQVNNIYIHT